MIWVWLGHGLHDIQAWEFRRVFIFGVGAKLWWYRILWGVNAHRSEERWTQSCSPRSAKFGSKRLQRIVRLHVICASMALWNDERENSVHLIWIIQRNLCRSELVVPTRILARVTCSCADELDCSCWTPLLLCFQNDINLGVWKSNTWHLLVYVDICGGCLCCRLASCTTKLQTKSLWPSTCLIAVCRT